MQYMLEKLLKYEPIFLCRRGGFLRGGTTVLLFAVKFIKNQHNKNMIPNQHISHETINI
jgi:hypothetical protein